MSRISHRDLEEGNDPDDHRDQPQPSHAESNFFDSSWPIFSIYSKKAEEEDKKLAERWQRDADSILVFTGLFSATVATFAVFSVQDLKPSSQDTAVFYLGNIYQLLAKPNVSLQSIPSDVAIPPAFSPPTSAIWVNTLWFLSLTMSLTCAVTATLLQQWARRYIKVTQPSQCSPEKRARIRALFAGSTDKLTIKVLSAMLPCYLHISFLLFFIGLLIFLFQTNHVVFGPVMSWIGISLLMYIFITISSIFQSDGLLYTPLSSLVGSIYAAVFIFSLIMTGDRFGLQIWKRRGDILERDFERFSGDLLHVDEKHISTMSSDIDFRILEWTIDTLGEDKELENFFDAVPGFFSSNSEEYLLRGLPHRIRNKFEKALNRFLNRTVSSNTASESISRRLEICLNAAHAASEFYPPLQVLQTILKGRWHEARNSLHIGQSLRRWSNSNNEAIALHAQSIIARVVVGAGDRDDRWITLVKDEFGMADNDIQDYNAHGDSLSLAILIHITQRHLRRNFTSWDPSLFETFSSTDICNTLPRLQQDFCDLWNELIRKAQIGDPSTPVLLLKNLRHLYIMLHQGTDASPTVFCASTADHEHILNLPSLYPSCHCLHTAPSQPPAMSSHILPHLDPTLSSAIPPTDPHTPSSVPDPGHVPDALQYISSAAKLSHLLQGGSQHDIVTPCLAPDVTNILSTANAIPHFIPSSVAVPTINVVPSTIVSTSFSSPIVMPAHPSGVIPAEVELNSPIESAFIQPDHVSRSLRSPPSSTITALSHISPPFTSVSDARTTTTIGSLHTHHGTCGLDPPFPMEVFHHTHQTTPPPVDASQPEE